MTLRNKQTRQRRCSAVHEDTVIDTIVVPSAYSGHGYKWLFLMVSDSLLTRLSVAESDLERIEILSQCCTARVEAIAALKLLRFEGLL